jgi:hypothetical protein
MNWRTFLRSSEFVVSFLAPETAGAMIAFSTFFDSQMGQTTLPDFDWLSKAAESLNQPSNSWRL